MVEAAFLKTLKTSMSYHSKLNTLATIFPALSPWLFLRLSRDCPWFAPRSPTTVHTGRPHSSLWTEALGMSRSTLACTVWVGSAQHPPCNGETNTRLRVGQYYQIVILTKCFWAVFMCVAEAVPIKSAAARRRALRHCVIRVNSCNNLGHYDSAISAIMVSTVHRNRPNTTSSS